MKRGMKRGMVPARSAGCPRQHIIDTDAGHSAGHSAGWNAGGNKEKNAGCAEKKVRAMCVHAPRGACIYIFIDAAHIHYHLGW